jgi:hypothetical protein
MNQEIRAKLRNVVTQCRKLLEDDTRDALEGKYAIFARKDQVTADPQARMTHLTGDEPAARQDILDHYAHIQARGFKPKEALDQLIREIAFTHLNRLCAYKMMEAREVYVGGQKFREAVSRGGNSNGVKFYLAEHPEDERLFNTGQQEVAYRHFLDWLGSQLSEEIGVLFSPTDPANRLYPRQKTLDEVLELLNTGGIKPEETELRAQWPQIWSQDETIGWVYQYFTPKELRDQARKESQAPRNSYELAFRNQFFTPRYVVEFLTDNTLGRIWYEMRKGDTKLKDQCRYLVRRPTEIFLNEGQQPPPDATEAPDELSQEELLKLPVHIPHRPKKDPRDLKILDPACGSGHFLLYCFDLLLTIYEEAYTDRDLGPALKKDYPTLEALQRDVPRLILAHNLHGIDIDLRASQIAALALWLRCQRAYQEMGLKKDRPQITRSNFVCAEPMPGEEQMLKEFVSELEPKVLGQVVEVVFDKMQLAGEAGSLLKIEEEIRDALVTAKKQYVRETSKAKDRKGYSLLFTQATLDRVAGKPEERSLFDLSDITDNQFFEQAEAQVIAALRSYAEKAQYEERLQRRLFSEDAVRGFAFVELCQQQYDVVLMNPPFGVCSESTEKYFRSLWNSLANDIYVLFLTVFSVRLTANGCLGAITSRGFMIGRDQRDFRPLLLGKGTSSLALLLDLGLDVLDTAAVETCAFVLNANRKNSPRVRSLFLDARMVSRSAIDGLLALLPKLPRYSCTHSRFLSLPQSPLIYTATDDEITSFATEDHLDPTFGKVTKGLSSSCDDRFIRLCWEVAPAAVGERWKFCAKGADYQWLVTNITAVVDWLDNGRLIREFTASVSTNIAQAYRSSKYYYRSGLTYTYRCNDFSLRALPEGCLFTNSAPVIIAKDKKNAPSRYVGLLSVFMTERFEKLLAHVSKKGKYDTGRMGKLPNPTLPEGSTVQSAWENCTSVLLRHESTLETSPYFVSCAHAEPLEFDEDDMLFRLRQFASCSGVTPSESFLKRAVRGYTERYVRNNSWPHSTLSYFIGVAFARWDIRRAINGTDSSGTVTCPFASLPTMPPGALGLGASASKHSVSHDDYVAVSSDGVIPDDPDHPLDVIRLARNAMEYVFRGDSNEVERRMQQSLAVSEVRDYLRKPGNTGFWGEHIKRYTSCLRKAPVYWLLQSSKKNYALWLFYHRLDKDLLFKALVNYVEPKIRLETSRLESLRTQKAATGQSGKEAKRLAKEVERQEDFLSELRDFEDKLRRAANRHLEPDLNDGVVLNIAPLWELVPWKEAKIYWDELLAGKYEWSSIGKQLRERGLVKC